MSAAIPDHAQSESRVFSPSSPQYNIPMSGIAHPRSSPGPIAGGAGGQIAHAGVEEHKNGGANKKVKTRSLDYVFRSGLAGGLAGCAVSTADSHID